MVELTDTASALRWDHWIINRIEHRWSAFRSLAHGLWLARVSTASVLIGALLFYHARAAQDLFLEVLDGWQRQLGYWTLFYVVVLLFWVFPVYLSARWILVRADIEEQRRSASNLLEGWVRRGVPPLLAASCLGAVLIGQVLAVSNAPILTDSGITQKRAEVLKEQMKTACPAWDPMEKPVGDLAVQIERGKCRALDVIIAGSRSIGFGLGNALGSDRVILVLYTICAVVLLWVMLKHYLTVIGRKNLWSAEAVLYWIATSILIIPAVLFILIVTPLIVFNLDFDDFIDAHGAKAAAVVYISSIAAGTLLWWRRAEAVFWWIITCSLVIPIVAITVLVTFGFVESELEQPYGLWHLALLPPTTALIGVTVWWGLRHRSNGQASRIAQFLMRARGTKGPIDELTATEQLVKPIFMILAIVSAAGLVLLIVLVPPVKAAHDILFFKRSLLIPFFLGMLVPPLTVLSSLSIRARAPLLLAAILLVTLGGQLFVDPHRVRTLPTAATLPSLKESVEQWARANRCKLGLQKGIDACPAPIIVAAAGGGSRAAFHFAGIMGALMDNVLPPVIFYGHSAPIVRGGFSPDQDGRRIVTVSADKTARLWDTEHGNEIPNLRRESGSVEEFVFSPDGHRLLTMSSDKSALLWDTENGKQIAKLPHENVTGAVFSGDGARILSRSSDQVRIWNSVDGTNVAVLKHADKVAVALLSHDGKRALTLSEDGTTRLWGAERDSDIPIANLKHEKGVKTAVFSRDGARILTSSDESTAQLWSAADGALIAKLEHDGPVSNASFSHDGMRILTRSTDKTVRIWEGERGAFIRKLPHESAVYRAIFSPDGKYVLTLSSDKVARVWDGEHEMPINSFSHGSFINDAVFSGDGKRILMRSSGKIAWLWDLERDKKSSLAHDDTVRDAVFSRPDGHRVLTRTSNSSNAFLWDSERGTRIAADSLGHEGRVTGVVFSPDGSRVLTYSEDKTARLWDSTSGKPVLLSKARDFRPFEKQVFAISGVSGGSLGAVIFYAALADSQIRESARTSAGEIAPPCKDSADASDLFRITGRTPEPTQKWKDCLQLIAAGDFLSPVFLSMITGDLIGIQPKDRTVVLEEAWEARYLAMTGQQQPDPYSILSGNQPVSPLARPMLSVRDAVLKKTDLQGWLPILLLNGTSVQTGRRIIVSDVDTQGLFEDAYDLHERLRGEVQTKGSNDDERKRWDVRLSTAATISARFPGISPHGDIVRDGKVIDRVVDGGYYENFGASTALELSDALKNQGLQPFVILVNNEPSMSNLDCSETKVEAPPMTPKPDPWETFTTLRAPFDAVLGTRSARGTHAATQLCNRVKPNFAFITVSQQEGATKKELAVSWWLSKYIQRYLDVDLLKANGRALEKIINVRQR